MYVTDDLLFLQGCKSKILSSACVQDSFLFVLLLLDSPGSKPGGDKIFLLGPTQSPVKWVLGLSRW